MIGTSIVGPHAGQRVSTAGRPLEEAAAAVILVHGRGATAESILELGGEIDDGRLALLAPQAAGRTWYPYSFLAPVERNEPGRSSGLAVIDALIESIAARGIPASRVLLLGFSQGACLTVEYAARRPRRFGGVAVLTGGLLGPDGALADFRGSLAGTPVLLASGDPDPHVPWKRVEATAAILEELGAEVSLRRYPGFGHSVHPEAIALVRELVARLDPPR